MADETKVFIEQLADQLRDIATQLNEALKAVQAGRNKLNTLLNTKFLGSEFGFVKGIGEHIQNGLNNKSLQVGTTVPFCERILKSVELIKKIKIDGVEVTNDILISEDRSEDVKSKLTEIGTLAAGMAEDKGGKTGKKNAVARAVDELIKALMDEMKKGLGISADAAKLLRLNSDTSPEDIEKARSDYINNKLEEAGLAKAFEFTDRSPQVIALVASLPDGDIAKLTPEKLAELNENTINQLAINEVSKDETLAIPAALSFLRKNNLLEILPDGKFDDYKGLQGRSLGDTKLKISEAGKQACVTASQTRIDEVKKDADSAKAGDLDIVLRYLAFDGKNLGTMITNLYNTEIATLIQTATDYALEGKGAKVTDDDLLNSLKTLKTDVMAQADGARDVNVDVRAKIGEIEKVDEKAAAKILKSYDDIPTADSVDSLDKKIGACKNIIGKIIDKDKVDGPVGHFDDLFG